MESKIFRRDVLILSAAGGTAALAGCSSNDDDGEPPSDDNGEASTNGNGESEEPEQELREPDEVLLIKSGESHTISEETHESYDAVTIETSGELVFENASALQLNNLVKS
ncbi:hypothetical protein [Natranaeroarchaeum sulfidigenes]|uniref:Uncharacterized protein n=1 Tax=Natranaeroarchaeum sulfidigenes TaxID=2784880 RepID=A0A897MR96_9EURY|nr:hypothetical protein [Natranaeroarchaeum sulfidigenes]QSG02528.1 hypothetical protein AArcS_1311 [Natranaeroarchaeum sulfidigenes]